MLTTCQKIAAIAALAIFFAIAVAGEVCESSRNSHPLSSQPPSQSVTACNDQNASRDAKKDCVDEAIARYTFWLVMVTSILAVATIGLGIGTFVQIRLARQEFISTHRPRLRVRRVYRTRPIIANLSVAAKIEIANIGETNATIVEFGFDIYVENQLYNAVPRAWLENTVIEAGKQATIDIIASQIITAQQVTSISATPTMLRMLGIVNYRDDNRTLRTTSFARVHVENPPRFIKVGPNDPDADRDYEN